ncbi:COP1-interacting protein 7-like [Bidens hawaiensis]|uniref:COP1-interacting protein 7-like n=1 Tax=Bidens hawaiensis TaxID=980011 RepID=UPI00404B7F35
MDSRMRLDYALFQLTPTRTRCDLIICAGDCKEKLASGLLEPCISHLKFAKDEAAKGGYSITLSAPDSASWFTKSTLERFVRFVSTPEVLERFVTIETEIKNIDGSINTNVTSDSQTIYSLDEHFNKSTALSNKPEDNTSDTLHEDDSKIHLQRALETRKAVLQKEQAMVYARALVVGFETDVLQDLICFTDAFGSPRLREACLSFIELCHTKSNDRIWMDEVAAMQAYSRSQYSYMEDDLGQELRIDVQNGNFANKTQNESPLPQYMHSYQGGPMFHPAYQGYPFPYYQGNLPWPPEDSRSSGRRSHKKRSKKLTQDGGSDSSDSSDSDSYKRSSAKKVIIRNVNYITSARDEESEHESDANREGQKVTQQWNIFQNLLMKDADDQESMEEYVSHKFEDPNIITSGNQPEFTNISSTTTKHEEKDWYLKSAPNKGSPERSRDIFEDHIEVVESTKEVHFQYNMTVQDRSLNEDSDSRLKTPNSFMVSESNVAQKKVEAVRVNEPNDLHMVLERDTAGNQAVPAWTPEMESDNRNTKIVKMDSPEVNKSKTKGLVEKGLVKKGSTVETKSKALAGTRKKTPAATKTTIVKGRSEKEEEKRKKMQELLNERQKRIAERSASTAKTAKNIKPKAQQTTKNDKPKAQQTIKNDKPKSQQTIKNNKPKAQQTTRNDKPKSQQTAKSIKPKAQLTTNYDKFKAQQTPKAQIASRDVKSSNKAVIRSSTIDRLSTARVVNPKVLPSKPKPGNKSMNPPTKRNVVPRTLSSQKAAEVEKKKENPKTAKPLGNNIVAKNSYGLKKNIVEQNKSKQVPKASQIKKTGNAVAHIGSLAPAYSDHTKSASETLPKASSVAQKDTAVSESNGGSNNKAVSFKINEDFNGAKKNSIAKVKYEAPVMETLARLPAKVSSESSSSKKKWRSLETPSKALSSFKKLLSFGRRS